MFDDLEKQLDLAFDEFYKSMESCPAFIKFIFFKSMAKRAVEAAKQAGVEHAEEMKKAKVELLSLLKAFEKNDEPDDDIEDSISEESKAEFLN